MQVMSSWIVLRVEAGKREKKWYFSFATYFPPSNNGYIDIGVRYFMKRLLVMTLRYLVTYGLSVIITSNAHNS